MKRCSRCKEEKPLSEFYRNKNAKDGHTAACKNCNKAYSKRYYQENKETLKTKFNSWLHSEQGRTWSKSYYRRLKKEALDAYSNSNPKCSCCGESHIEFLTIDHMNGGGYEHRKKIKTSIYQWLKKNNYPEGYRVLCMNCNFSIGMYGYCPHSTNI